MTELIISEITDLKPIDFNYEEIKKDLTEKLEKYKKLVYTDESIKDAKSDRAKLNKLYDAMNDKKIEVKKQFMQPYDEFESKMKELLSLVKEPVQVIDAQIKAFEIKQKEEKREKINQILSGCADGFSQDLKLILPLTKIFDEKWLNASISLVAITKEITEKVTKISNDISVIESFKSEFDVQLKDKYISTLDLGAVMIEKARLEQIKAQIEERKRAEEKIKEAAVILPQQEIVQAKVEEPISQIVEAPKEDIITIDFRVYATKSQLELLKQFLTQNNIKYGKVN